MFDSNKISASCMKVKCTTSLCSSSPFFIPSGLNSGVDRVEKSCKMRESSISGGSQGCNDMTLKEFVKEKS